MGKYCKNCKHSRENDQAFSGLGIAMIPLLGVPIPGIGVEDLECNNRKSIYYLDGVDDYDTCTKFEKK